MTLRNARCNDKYVAVVIMLCMFVGNVSRMWQGHFNNKGMKLIGFCFAEARFNSHKSI